MSEFEQLVALITDKVIQKIVKLENEEESDQPGIFVIGQASTSLVQMLTESGYQLVSKLTQESALCLAELSVGRLSRIAQMMPRDTEEELILARLMAKKEVLVSSSGLEYGGKLISYPYSIKKQINEFEEAWQRYGAIFLRDLKEQESSKVLSVTQLQQLMSAGSKVVTVKEGTIVTPLAKDFLKEHQLTLIKK